METHYMRSGPMRCSDRALEELSKPIFTHRGETFRKLYMDVIEKVGIVIGCSGRVVPITASGTGGNEFMVSNLIYHNEYVLCLVNGYFSERLFEQVQSYTDNALCAEVSWGDVVRPEQVESFIEETKSKDWPGVMTVVSSETSTGAWTNISKIAELCRKHGTMLLVDHVSGVGNPYDMDALGVDATVMTTHESFACPPGLALVAFSKRAVEKATSIFPPRSHYMSLPHYLKYQDTAREPPFTVPTTLFAALNENLDALFGEGIAQYFERCKLNGHALRTGLSLLGFTVFTKPYAYNNTCSAAYSPYSSTRFVNDLKERFGVEVATGQGDYKEDIFRVAHNGVITIRDITALLDALQVRGTR